MIVFSTISKLLGAPMELLRPLQEISRKGPSAFTVTGLQWQNHIVASPTLKFQGPGLSGWGVAVAKFENHCFKAWLKCGLSSSPKTTFLTDVLNELALSTLRSGLKQCYWWLKMSWGHEMLKVILPWSARLELSSTVLTKKADIIVSVCVCVFVPACALNQRATLL